MTLTILTEDDETEDDLPPSLHQTILDLKDRIKDLETDLENMTRKTDEQYDRAETLQEEVDELRQNWIDPDSEDHEETSSVVDLCRELKDSYERLSMGVNTEIDNIIETTNKILEKYL